MNKKIFPVLIWLLPLSFFAYQFILRVSPGVFMHEIMQKFHVDALSFGVLSAIYYIGYAGMQIPIGIMLDKYNPVYVIAGSILAASIGSYLLGTTSHWPVVLFSRFLIGAGSAVGFLGTAKIVRMYFSKAKYSIMIGFSFTLGLCGAIYGGKPLALLSQELGWEEVLVTLSAVALLIAVSVLLFASSARKKLEDNKEESVLTLLRELFNKPVIIFIGLFGGLMVGPLEGFADVWGIPYLTTIYKISKAEASLLVSTIFIGMCFGGPLLSFFGEKLNSHNLITIMCGVIMSLLFVMLIGANKLDNNLLLVVFFVIGVLSCYQVTVFTIVSNMVPGHLTGLATAVVNSMNMAFGFVFHIAIGAVMDNLWQGEMIGNIRIYSKEAYNAALSIIPFCAMLGAAGFFAVALKVRKKGKVVLS